jgi:hypothetical protein
VRREHPSKLGGNYLESSPLKAKAAFRIADACFRTS